MSPTLFHHPSDLVPLWLCNFDARGGVDVIWPTLVLTKGGFGKGVKGILKLAVVWPPHRYLTLLGERGGVKGIDSVKVSEGCCGRFYADCFLRFFFSVRVGLRGFFVSFAFLFNYLLSTTAWNLNKDSSAYCEECTLLFTLCTSAFRAFLRVYLNCNLRINSNTDIQIEEHTTLLLRYYPNHVSFETFTSYASYSSLMYFNAKHADWRVPSMKRLKFSIDLLTSLYYQFRCNKSINYQVLLKDRLESK